VLLVEAGGDPNVESEIRTFEDIHQLLVHHKQNSSK
jgi:hypothetical protein